MAYQGNGDYGLTSIPRRPVSGQTAYHQVSAHPNGFGTHHDSLGSKEQSHEETAGEALREWPAEPTRLGKKGVFSRYISPVFDAFLAILPVLFIILGILAKSVDQKLVTDHTWALKIITATHYGVTIYPILFAAIIGSVMQSISAWLVERGATIMVLEQLTGSATLFGTFKTQLQLGAQDYRAALLILLWALSPLGGQGTLRLLSVENQASLTTSPVWYLTTNGSDGSLFNEDTGPQIDPVNSIFLSSLIAPNDTQDGPQDTWGNIKIPWIEDLAEGAPQTGQWYMVPGDASYSSLVGVPVAAIPREDNSTFIMSATYMSLSCPDGPQLLSSQDEIVWSDTNHTTSDSDGGIGGYVQGSREPVVGTGSSRFYKDGSWVATFSLGSFGPFQVSGSAITGPMSIYFQSVTDATSGDIQQITALNCSLTTSHVDNQVQCEGQNCAVTSMRLTPGLPYPDSYSPVGREELAWEYFDNFEPASGYYDSLNHYVTNSITEQYMKYGSSPLAFPDRALPTNLSNIAGDDLAVRLARLMNSYWIPSIDPMNMVGTLPSASDLSSGNASLDGGFVGQKTEAQVATLEEIFVCHDTWLGILLVSSSVLLLCALAGLLLKSRTKGPDIFGHVSSFTRDNPFVHIPAGGSTLSGFERAKLLKNVKIKIGDTKPAGDYGHVAIMSSGPAGQFGRDTTLTKRRLYD